jgi:hypothetical protein
MAGSKTYTAVLMLMTPERRARILAATGLANPDPPTRDFDFTALVNGWLQTPSTYTEFVNTNIIKPSLNRRAQLGNMFPVLDFEVSIYSHTTQLLYICNSYQIIMYNIGGRDDGPRP